jgi:hypothetical protein
MKGSIAAVGRLTNRMREPRCCWSGDQQRQRPTTAATNNGSDQQRQGPTTAGTNNGRDQQRQRPTTAGTNNGSDQQRQRYIGKREHLDISMLSFFQPMYLCGLKKASSKQETLHRNEGFVIFSLILKIGGLTKLSVFPSSSCVN